MNYTSQSGEFTPLVQLIIVNLFYLPLFSKSIGWDGSGIEGKYT